MSFTTIVKVLNRTEARDEDTKNSYRDTYQNGWVKALVSFERKGRELPNMQTIEEVHEAFTEQEKGLIVTAAKRARLSELRAEIGEGKQKHYVESIKDQDFEDDYSERQFNAIETMQTLQDRYQRMTPKEQAAVRYFVGVWLLKEAGYTIPAKMRAKLVRLRKTTGLPFEL